MPRRSMVPVLIAAALVAGVVPRCVAQAVTADSGDARAQYPPLLANSYFGASLGLIGYNFTERQLEPGFHATSVETPHPAVRIDLFGHQFSPRVSLQATYMRPVRYVRYRDVNGDQAVRQVSQAFGGVTLRSAWPVTSRVSLWGEGGLGIASRFGVAVDGVPVVRSAHFASLLVGGGIDYHLRGSIDIVAGLTVLPGRASASQPAMRLVTAGLHYWMRPLPPERVAANRGGGVAFPLQAVRLGYSSSVLSYGPNGFFSHVVPVFWSGDVETRRGFTVAYERNLFHTRTRFAFDLGGSLSSWKSNVEKDAFRTFSIYPLLRFFVHRTAAADYYATYSVAGPSYLSRRTIDGRDTGARFTFQDLLAAGAFIGRDRKYSVELGIKHFSNGNMFTSNAAVKIPLTITVGRTF